MTFIVGILTLPFLLWSWLAGKNEEDGELAISLIAWLILGSVAFATAWWVFR